MLNGNERIIKHNVGLLNLAEELGNVSKACQMMGVSLVTINRTLKGPPENRVDLFVLANCRSGVDPSTEWFPITHLIIDSFMSKDK